MRFKRALSALGQRPFDIAIAAILFITGVNDLWQTSINTDNSVNAVVVTTSSGGGSSSPPPYGPLWP